MFKCKFCDYESSIGTEEHVAKNGTNLFAVLCPECRSSGPVSTSVWGAVKLFGSEVQDEKPAAPETKQKKR
jgi:hypothetical protein